MLGFGYMDQDFFCQVDTWVLPMGVGCDMLGAPRTRTLASQAEEHWVLLKDEKLRCCKKFRIVEDFKNDASYSHYN